MEPLLQLENLNAWMNDKQVLSGVNFTLFPGEIHALVGEHGAGKSALVGLLSGTATRYTGRFLLDGRLREGFTTEEARGAEIGTVHQRPRLVPTFSPLENIYLGRYRKSPLRIIEFRRMRDELQAYLEEKGIPLELKKQVRELSKQERNRVSLLKAVFFDPRILILDEISSLFNQDEIELAYRYMQDLKARGRGIIYISNNTREIFEFADRVSIIRNGTIIRSESTGQMDRITLIDLAYSFATTREELKKVI